MLASVAVVWTMMLSEGKRLDMDRLARAVASAESSGCRSPVALRTNNCHGITLHGEYVQFSSTAESFSMFKRIWAKSYKTFPDHALAARYSSEGAADEWLCNVESVYLSLPHLCHESLTTLYDPALRPDRVHRKHHSPDLADVPVVQ